MGTCTLQYCIAGPLLTGHWQTNRADRPGVATPPTSTKHQWPPNTSSCALAISAALTSAHVRQQRSTPLAARGLMYCSAASIRYPTALSQEPGCRPNDGTLHRCPHSRPPGQNQKNSGSSFVSPLVKSLGLCRKPVYARTSHTQHHRDGLIEQREIAGRQER